MPIPRSILDRSGFRDLDLVLAQGTWPDDLAGEILISTSDQRTATEHAFFGDGAMLRLSLRPGTHGAGSDTWAWRQAIIDTPSQRLRAKRPEVFESTVIGTRSPFGMSNSANTAPLPWGDRLFATWDAGRPVEIDPVSMRFLGEVGHISNWAPAIDAPVLPLVASTAHPVIDPDRNCMWTVSFNPISQQLHVIRYDGDGTQVSRWPLAGAPIPQSMHTITQTREWLILADCAFRADPAEIFGTGERSVTNFTDEPLYFVRKDALDATPDGEEVGVTAFRIGPEVMHYFAEYDDADGVTILFEHTHNSDIAMYVREGDLDAFGRPVDPLLRGMYNHPMNPVEITIMRFDPATGRVTDRARLWDPDRLYAVQLSAMDWSTEGITRPTVHSFVCNGFRPEAIVQRAIELYRDRLRPFPTEELPSVLVTADRESLKTKAEHTYALDDYPTSPCFVPRDAGSAEARGAGRTSYAGSDPGGHDGYLVMPVLNDDGFRVEVFDAADVSRGPIATLGTTDGTTVPFLLHSAWMPRVEPASTSIERLSFADEVDDARLGELTPDLARAVHEVADELKIQAS